MYLLRSDDLDVEIGWNPHRLAFMCLVTQEDGEVVKMVETETAQECIDQAQPFVERRIRSVWLYRMINDQAPRAPFDMVKLVAAGVVEVPPSKKRKKRKV